ncbi:MAG: hypothetical protein KGM16_20015 [Bacteroidota bacterium]|nr:hypothetical protein [Bacteroidota bacterium]
MKKLIFLIVISLGIKEGIKAQVSPNFANAVTLPPTAEKATRMGQEPVNLFTGIPQIGVPLYSYQSAANGLSMNISLNYFAGGVGVTEAPTTVGLGWYLNAGGIITRTVRGIADEQSTGFMNTDTVPNDFRSKGNAYYSDSLDAEQDMFQYNFGGRSGTFFIGKNGQIAQMPLTKMKIIPNIYSNAIRSFTIKAEDGTSYVFGAAEPSSATSYGGYSLSAYNSAWSLTKIIAPFNTDTISLNYTQKALTTDFSYPALAYVKNSDGSHTYQLIPVGGNNTSTTNKVSSITFPDKTTVSFVYGNDIASNGDNELTLVKISDTTFRYGYILNYQSTDSAGNATRLLLKSVTPYTASQKGRGYSFSYYSPTLPPVGSAGDSIQNRHDFWGFYNGVSTNSTTIPDVNGYTWGADRSPSAAYAIAGTLKNFYLPQGGYINYQYELNDHYPYIKVSNKVSFTVDGNSTTTVNFNQVFDTHHEISFTMDSSVSRQGSPPFSGAGTVAISIENTAGTTTYAMYSLSLYDLFYKGIVSWDFDLPNGTYKIVQQPVVASPIPVFKAEMSWENKIFDSGKTADESGGLRIKKITRMTGSNDPAASVTEYKYVNTDGTSSGFLGDIAQYYYPYLETVNYNGVTTTAYTAVSGDPWLNNMDAGIAGYSRVEVYHGTTTHNSGKTVYEFTTPADANSLYVTATFPYAPLDLKSWGLGLTKKISVYDSTGTLVKKVTNSYGLDSSISYQNKNFRSLKLGISYAFYNGDPTNPLTTETSTYTGKEYYPPAGREYLASSTDTLYQSDGSKNTTYTNYTYDSNYNVIKIVTPYDRTRGLQLEKRLYYPYNYTVGDGVGLLRDNSIITPVIASESWITGDANPRIVGGTVTYYHQITGNYVKPLTIYKLQSNRPVPQSIIGTFSSSTLNRNTNYFVAQLNLSNYDSKGNLVSEKNAVSGISNSIIMDYNQNYPIAKVSNAGYSDIAYTSFEADGSGNWKISSSARDTSDAITGNRSFNLSNGNISDSIVNSSQTYLVSFWAKSSASVSVNGSPQTNILATQNNWNFYSTTVSNVLVVTISGTGLIDELRLYPNNANMVTYTYKPLIGVTSATDDNNTIVYNEYDALNRLKIVRDKDKNILKRFDYSDTTMSINTQANWIFSNTQCGAGDGVADSVYMDNNIYSSTYNSQKLIAYSDYCTCGAPGQHPDYKVVNGSCEQAKKCTTSSTYIKVYNPDNTYYWTWKCVWHYKWSDGSVSPDYYDYHSSSCPIGCFYQL